jgi:hypothetical protein
MTCPLMVAIQRRSLTHRHDDDDDNDHQQQRVKYFGKGQINILRKTTHMNSALDFSSIISAGGGLCFIEGRNFEKFRFRSHDENGS